VAIVIEYGIVLLRVMLKICSYNTELDEDKPMNIFHVQSILMGFFYLPFLIQEFYVI